MVLKIPMSFRKNAFLVALSVIALNGCKEQITYNYLMQHPKVLKEKAEACDAQSIVEKSPAQITECKMVMEAASNMMSLINAQQEDPELFGQKILDAEIASANIHKDLTEAQKNLDKLKTNNPNLSTSNAAVEKVNKLKNDYEEKNNEVKVLLAVMGLGSPG